MPFNHESLKKKQRVTAELGHPLQAACIFKETMPDSLLSLILKHYRTRLALLQTYSFFSVIFYIEILIQLSFFIDYIFNPNFHFYYFY
jgi:hypothetical protein